MTAGGPPPGGEPPGAAIEELRRLRERPRPGFLDRVRRRVHRRVLVKQVADLGWFAPLLVLLEYLQVALSLLLGRADGKE